MGLNITGMSMTRKPAKQITKREIAAIHAFYAPAYGRTVPDIPKARAPSRDLEHKEQVAVIQWWHLAHTGFGLPEIALYANANGGDRHLLTAVRLKAEGVRSGVSDLSLCVARGGWNCAYIEMKSAEGRMSDAQMYFFVEMAKLKNRCVTCYSATEAIEFIKSYLRG